MIKDIYVYVSTDLKVEDPIDLFETSIFYCMTDTLEKAQEEVAARREENLVIYKLSANIVSGQHK